MGRDEVYWIYLAKKMRQWQTFKHGNEPSGSINGAEFID
jgi:hypothetical protein